MSKRSQFSQLLSSDSIYQQSVDTYLKTKQKAIQKYVEQQIYQLIKANPHNFIFHIPGVNDELIDHLESTEKQKYCDYALITVNFDTEQFYNNQQKILQTIGRRPKYVRRTAYVFEYHTSGTNHPHVHILIDIDRSKSKQTIYKSAIIQTYVRKFKFMELDQNNVDVKMRNTYQNTLKYIKGNKNDKNKVERAAQDAAWRKTHGLPDVYSQEFDQLESSENSSSLNLNKMALPTIDQLSKQTKK